MLVNLPCRLTVERRLPSMFNNYRQSESSSSWCVSVWICGTDSCRESFSTAQEAVFVGGRQPLEGIRCETRETVVMISAAG